MSTPPYPKLSSWFWAFVASTVLSGLTIFYGVIHLGLRVPLSKLKLPYLLFSILTIVLSPFLYLARKHHIQSGGDTRPFALILGAYYLLGLAIGVFFGMRVGVLSPGHATEYYVVVILSAVLGSIGGYYIHRAIFRRSSSV